MESLFGQGWSEVEEIDVEPAERERGPQCKTRSEIDVDCTLNLAVETDHHNVGN